MSCVGRRSYPESLRRVGARVGALGSALLLVHLQLQPVAELLGGDGVPPAVAEALALGRVLRRDPPGAVVHVEEQLEEQRIPSPLLALLLTAKRTPLVLLVRNSNAIDTSRPTL
ncbi:hypothetical protein EYF80_042854 [Liparis tanakae]|uniref:Uncharacterized protein n=1 Tax=Liparis tanakae TaxID=230148 RepID=A0A4Z2G027_9TELE|nr:hypothetical protein EYF80_042854 [Liparis tanakae]